jgi:hypothetical protein
MADEDSMDSTQAKRANDDEFAVRLGWGEAGGEDLRSSPATAADEQDRQSAPLLPGVSPDGHIIERTTDAGDRREMHQIRTLLADLRNDVTALRRAVRGSTELQELTLSIVELRAEVAELLEAAPLDEIRSDIAALRHELEQIPQPERTSLPISVLEPILSELGALRSDLVAIKRRTALRAAQSSERTTEEVEQIARLVVEKLSAGTSRRSRRG